MSKKTIITCDCKNCGETMEGLKYNKVVLYHGFQTNYNFDYFIEREICDKCFKIFEGMLK